MTQDLMTFHDVDRTFIRSKGLIARSVDFVKGRQGEMKGVKALSGINLALRAGQMTGLVGESGCGKTTLGRIAGGLLDPTAGHITRNGKRLEQLDREEARRIRLKTQIVFQDPYASLNPRMRIRSLIGEAPRVHRYVSAGQLDAYVRRYAQMAGVAEGHLDRYPHQLSGGQRQRVCIARALAMQPDMVVFDEAVSALDVSVQAQILNLLADLQADLKLTSLFISHDLGVVRHIADQVVVMYLGEIVEQAPAAQLFEHAAHPYTRALIAEMPKPKPVKRRFAGIAGEVPSPLNPPSGCRFHTRCPQVMEVCKKLKPATQSLGPGHTVACHLFSGQGGQRNMATGEIA